MRRILIFLCLVAPVISDIHKMMVNYGFVVKGIIHKGMHISIEFEKLELSWSDCLNYCLKNMSCVVVQEAGTICKMYRFPFLKEVIKVDAVNGSKVGIKRIMNYCPAIETGPPLFGKAIVQEKYESETTMYSYTITETTGTDVRWIFNSEYYFECESDSFISIRGINRVCISFRNLSSFDPPCQNLSFAKPLCQQNGGLSLTAPYSKEEGEMLTRYAKGHIDIDLRLEHPRFWIDGDFESEKFVVSDDTLNGTAGFNWSPSFDLSEIVKGPIFTFMGQDNTGPTYVYVSDEDMDLDWMFGVCMAGVFCRTQPLRNL